VETRRIGTLEVSVVGLGCNNFGWKIDESATRRVIDASIASGVNFLDTSDTYGKTKSEEMIGRALKGKRASVIIATKFGKPVDPTRTGARPEYVHQACNDSLRRLDTDYIDLYQLHAPDPTVPIADTLGALAELVEPVFAHTKHTRQITRFTRRGLTAVRAEWQLIAATHNLLKLFRYQPQTT
jgi:aryl-alcohol dehydrogenase-like predicted oxidoreductase